ncbi:helix-turn-helix domain-containing protein [Nocardia gipuzkoensis]
MDGSLSLNPVVELRTLFEGLPPVVRRPIELVVFGGDLPRADVSGMRWMARELRSKAAAMNGHAEDAEKLLAQEDSLGALGDRVREILRLHREGAAKLREEALALADQAHAAANDAEKTLCVMFAFGVELAWRIIATLSAAAAAGPAGELAAAPVVESMLIEGRGKVALMRAGLEQAYKVGAAKTAARLSALGPHQFAFTVAKAAALPAGVDLGVQLMQVGSGDRNTTVKGPNGENPRGIDLKSVEAAAVSGAGGALGGIAAGTIAPRVFPRLETSRSALGLVQGVAGAVSGLGAAALITGWPEHFEDVLASLLSGGFAGVVDVHGGPHSTLGSPLAKGVDGSGAYVPPDPSTVNLSKDAVLRLAGAPLGTKSLTPASPAPVDSNADTTLRPANSALPGHAMATGALQPGEKLVSAGPPGATGDGQHEPDESGDLRRLADSGSGEQSPALDGHTNSRAGADGQPTDPTPVARQGHGASADRAGDGAPPADLPTGGDEPSGGAARTGGNAQDGSGAAQTSDPARGSAQAGGAGDAHAGDGGQAGNGGGTQARNGQAGGGAGGGGNAQAGGVPGAGGGGAQGGSGVASGAVLSGAGGAQSGSEPQRSADHGEDDAHAVGGSRGARAPVGDGAAGHEPAVARPKPGPAKVDPPAEVGNASGGHGAGGEGPARVTAPKRADLPPAQEPSVGRSEDAVPADARPSVQDGPDRPAEQLAQELLGLPSADPATKQDLTAERQAQFKAAAKKALALYRLRQEELAGESWEQRRHAMEHGDRVESLLRYIDAMREGTGKTPRWNQIKAFLLGEHGFMRQMGTGQGKSMVGALDTLWQLSRGEPVELGSGESVRVHHVITTTEVLANEGVREFAPVLRSLGYEIERWDPHNPPGEAQRPTVYYMTYDERATAELFDRPPPGKTATIDEADAVLVHNQTVHYQSEGQREIASEVEAAGVYRVRDFLKAVLRSRITAAKDLSVHLEEALHDGPLTAEEAGAARTLTAEEVGAARTLTARSLRDQPEECLDTVSRLWESYAGRKFTAEETEMARAFLDVKAGRLKLNRDFQVFGEGIEKKVQILDEYGKPRSDPKIGTESRWFGGRHKMVEAMFGAPVYSDGTGSKQVTVEDVLGGYEHLHLMSGTLERTAAEIKENFPVEGGLAKVEDFGRSKLAGEEDRIFLTEPEKLRDAVTRVQQLQAEGRPVLVICPFNDLARKFSLMLTKADVEHNAIDARWFAEHRDNNAAEEHLLSVKDTAGVRGAVTVGTGMLGRGFDVSISDEIDQLGGVHAHMLGRSPTNPDEDHQWSARAGRNGRNGSFCFNVAASDRLYSEAQQHGARVAVTHYRAAVAKHADATAEYTETARQAGDTDAAQPGKAVQAARTKVAAAAADVAAAEREMRSLTSPLQNDAADRTYLQRAMRRANQAHAPPATGDLAATSVAAPQSTVAASLLHTEPGAAHTPAGVDQTRSDSGHAGARMDRAAMEAVHAGPDAVQPHLRGDRFARLAGWLGIPASVQAAAAMFDTGDDDDPLSRLLERAGVSSAAVEALNQHLDYAPPVAVMQADALTDEQALNHLTPQRNRLAAELGWEPAQVAGAEGVRQVGAAVDTARKELADLLDVPAAEVNAATARDVLADAVARLLARTETADDPATELLAFAASTYLAVTALLDLAVAIHQRSPKSCVNNGVTMMRVLYPDNAHAYRMPADLPLRGHDAEDTERAFGGAFRAFGSLDAAAESLEDRPRGSQALVYKWMNKGQVESHLVLLVNDSDRRDAPNLVVVDIAAAPGQVPITPADLAARPALLNKAVPFQQWRRAQQALIDRLKEADRGVFAIEFDHKGQPLARVPATQRSAVTSQNPGLPPPSLWSSRAPPLRRNEFDLAGHRPPGDGALPDISVPADTSEPDTQPSNVGSMEGRIGSRPPAGPDREPTWYERIAAGFTAADTERTGRATQGGTPELGWLTSVLGVPTAYFDSPVGMTVLGERPEDALAADILSLWHRLGALAAEFENRGFGQWYERTMLRLTSWVVSTPVQRYRNFYAAEQGGVDDRRVPLGASGEVGLAGNLHAVLKTSQGTPGGGVMFDEMWDELGDIVHGIEGYWVRDRLHLTDNLDTFNAGIRRGLSPEAAARATFTGKMADRKGFTEVVVGDLDGELGDYQKVEVTFVRPSRLWEVRCRTLAHQTGVQFPELLNRVGWSSEIARLREHAARQHASMRRMRSHRPGDAEVPADWSSWQQAIEAKVARVEQLAEWVERWWAEQDTQDHAAVAAVAADVVRRHPGARWVTPNTVLLPSRTVVVIAEEGRHDDALTDMLLRNLELRDELGTAGYDVRRLKPVVDYGVSGNPAVRAEDLGTVRVGGTRGPGGYIGSRPREESSSGDRASAGPDFQDLVLAGRGSGPAERSLVEDAPGVRVESVTFGNGTRVFAETYTDPVAALEQVLQRKVAEIMDAPVGRTCLILEDDTVYREIVPGRPGDSVALDQEILGSRSATRLGLFDAVTRTNRAAREWSAGPDNEVRGGRAPSAIDATPTGAFAARFVRQIDGREVWQHHGMPRAELSTIRERVAYLQSWISNLPVPKEYKPALHRVHGRYMDALAEVEWRAARTPDEISRRAGLHVEAQAKARLVETFNLDYPHITIAGFEHPDVPAHVVEEILGALDEMLTRFPGRTNIRGLWIDYLGDENASAASFAQRDSESTFRTLGIQFSLRNASRPAWTVERGIAMRERGFNPIGDRPFHHDAVHEFVHAIDAVELLSVPLRQVLHEIWSRLHELGLREPEQTWLARLPVYAFVDETKAQLREHEALAVGFAETDLHGAAVGTPQWAIHEYVTAGRPPQITPDVLGDLQAQGNQPISASAPHPEGTGDADLTRPSRDPDPDAVPSGSEAVVPVLGPGQGPPGFLQEQRGLRRQNEAAVVLARAGFRVEQHPVESGARLPDFRIEGQLFDCYSPATGKVSNICFEIRRKVYVKRQAERIVVNLADSTADPGELSLALRRHPIPTLREILAIDRHGTVLRLWPGPVTVVGSRPGTGHHGFIGSRPPERTPAPLDSSPDAALTSDARLLNEEVRAGRGPLRSEHFPVPGLRMRSNDPGRNAALRMFSLWQAYVANRGLGKLVSRWDSAATPAMRRRVLAELYFWVSQQRYMRQVWAVGRDPSVAGEHGESHPDYFRTRLGDDAPNMDMVGHLAGLRAGVRRDPQTGKWHGGVGTPAFWTTLAIGGLVRSRMDVEAPGSEVLQNVVELPGGARVDGNVLYASEPGRFVIETARAGDQRTIFDAALAELAAVLDQRSPQPSADVLRRLADAVYLLFQAPLMTRGSDATIRTFAATVFTFAFGRPLRLPHDIDLQAMSRRQPDFVEWFTGALERGLRKHDESDAAGRPDALRETVAWDRPPGFIGSRPQEQSDPSLDASRGAWLKALRLEQGMKQKDVAQAAGLTNAALSNIENGRRTSLGTFQQVCRVLGVEGEALTEATRRFYPGVEIETDAAAHNSPGSWVAAHRNSRGMTKADLARAVGVTPTRIWEIENGDRPPPNLFFRIARALGVGQQALGQAARSLYPDIVLDLEPTAHDPASPGNWIMTQRHSQDMTQAEVARTAGTSAGYIAGIEGGEYTPNSIIFRRICRALEVAPELLGVATRHFYPDLELELDPGAHDPASPGSWIVALRHDRDWTRTELANAIGPGWGHLAHIETGNYVPRFAVFRRICAVSGIDDELLRAATRHFYPHIDLDLEPVAQDLGRWITALRHDRDMGRAELARVTGLSTKYLAQVETENRRPRFGTFRRICRALGVSGSLLIQAVRDFYPDITADIDPASHESLGRWFAALRNDEGISATELARLARIPRSTLSSIENNRYLPRLSKLRQLCRAQGVGGEFSLEIVERFYAGRYERSGYRDEEELFKRYVVTRVGSPEEREVQDEILQRFTWVPKAVARREPPDIRDDAIQAAWIGMLSAIANHVPSASFAAHAWASCRAAVFRYRLALRFPDLDNRTRKLVSTVEAQIHRMVSAGAALEDTEIARGAGLKVADVALAREILARPTLRLDAPISGNDGSMHRDVADPAPAGFSDTDFAMTVRAALADMADPATAERLVMLHLVEGMSLARAAERLGLPTPAAADVLAEAIARLRSAFDHREPADVAASEQNRPTPWSKARAEPDQPPNPSGSHGDSAPDEGMTGPDGFIGSRPPEPGESSRTQAPEETPRATPWSRLSDSEAHDPPDGSAPSAAWPAPNGTQPFRLWLKAARLAHGLTQAGLAARIDVPNSATYIGSLERGVTITRDMAVRLLEGLGAPVEVAEAVLREYFPREDGEFPDPRSDRFRHPKDWIIAARTSKGLSRAELAARAGVGLTGLSQKERAHNPRGEFGISPDYALRLLAGLDAPGDIATAFMSRFYPGWGAGARADERRNTGP